MGFSLFHAYVLAFLAPLALVEHALQVARALVHHGRTMGANRTMSATYPHPCSHCGLCCINETCPIGQHHHGITKLMPCPSLQMTPDGSSCALVKVYGPKMMGSGAGCCIKAVAVGGDGVLYDFAALPPQTKSALAGNVWRQKQEQEITV